MNIGLLVQDVLYGEQVHKIICEIDMFHAEITKEFKNFKEVLDEIGDCPSFRNLLNEVDRRVAFRILIREMHFRYTSSSPESIFPIIITHLLLLGQERILQTPQIESVVSAAASEAIRWILIGHELEYFECHDLREQYRDMLGKTYNHWIAEWKSSDEAIARGSFGKTSDKVTDRRSFL